MALSSPAKLTATLISDGLIICGAYIAFGTVGLGITLMVVGVLMGVNVYFLDKA